MKRILLVLVVLCFQNMTSQQKPLDKQFFTEALFYNLSDYNKKADIAYRFNDFEKGKQLFEDFTNDHLEGSYMDNFKFQSLNKKEVSLYDFKKPIFLITYASWCIPSKGEIPALNELAKEYRGEIEFVVLFWDTKETVKKLANQFSSQISVVYVDETKNNGAYVVKQLKHSLGLPTCFLLSEDKQIRDIRRSVFTALNTDDDTAYRENYIALETSISKNLIQDYDEVYADNLSIQE